MVDFLQAKLEVLLEAGEAAVQRTRFVFLAISVAGAVILAAQFNVAIPWIRNVVVRPDVPVELKNRVEDLRWKDLYVVSVPLVGIKFSAFDLGVVGSTGLAVLSVWFFYCARRENHVINTIVKQANLAIQSNDLERAAYLYYGIAHHFVFLTITRFSAVGGKPPQVLGRLAVRVLEFIPVWVPLCVLVVDLWSLYQPHKTGIHPTRALWSEYPNEHLEVILRIIFLLLVVLFSFMQVWGANQFASDTRRRLNAVRQQLEPEVSM